MQINRPIWNTILWKNINTKKIFLTRSSSRNLSFYVLLIDTKIETRLIFVSWCYHGDCGKLISISTVQHWLEDGNNFHYLDTLVGSLLNHRQTDTILTITILFERMYWWSVKTLYFQLSVKLLERWPCAFK